MPSHLGRFIYWDTARDELCFGCVTERRQGGENHSASTADGWKNRLKMRKDEMRFLGETRGLVSVHSTAAVAQLQNFFFFNSI